MFDKLIKDVDTRAIESFHEDFMPDVVWAYNHDEETYVSRYASVPYSWDEGAINFGGTLAGLTLDEPNYAFLVYGKVGEKPTTYLVSDGQFYRANPGTAINSTSDFRNTINDMKKYIKESGDVTGGDEYQAIHFRRLDAGAALGVEFARLDLSETTFIVLEL